MNPTKFLEFDHKITGHLEKVMHLILSPNKSILASCDMIGEIKIWNANNLKLITSFNINNNTRSFGYVIKFITDDLLVSNSEHNLLKIWSISNNKLVETINIKNFENKILTMAVLSENMLVIGSENIFQYDVSILDINKKSLVNIWSKKYLPLYGGNKREKKYFCVTSLSKNLLSISSNSEKVIEIFDINNLKTIHLLKGHNGTVSFLLRLNDDLLASSSFDLTVKIWDVKKGILLKSLEGHLDSINYLAVISKDLLASCSEDSTISIWNINDGRKIKILNSNDPLYSLAILPNGKILSGSFDSTIKVWDNLNIIENLSFSDNRKYNELEIRQKPKKTEIDFNFKNSETDNLSFGDNRKKNELEIRKKPKKTEIDFDLILKQKMNNSFSYKPK